MYMSMTDDCFNGLWAVINTLVFVELTHHQLLILFVLILININKSSVSTLSMIDEEPDLLQEHWL